MKAVRPEVAALRRRDLGRMVMTAVLERLETIEAEKDESALVTRIPAHRRHLVAVSGHSPGQWAGGRCVVRSVLPVLIPSLVTVYFTYTFVIVGGSGPFTITTEWAPALNLSLSFRFDGLSTMFATLIAGSER